MAGGEAGLTLGTAVSAGSATFTGGGAGTCVDGRLQSRGRGACTLRRNHRNRIRTRIRSRRRCLGAWRRNSSRGFPGRRRRICSFLPHPIFIGLRRFRRRLVWNRRQPLRQNIGRANRSGLELGGFLLHQFGDDQHFFEFAEIRGGFHPDVSETNPSHFPPWSQYPPADPWGKCDRRHWCALLLRAAPRCRS